MSDDWEKVPTAAPTDDWQPVTMAERPAPDVGEAMPEAFIARISDGQRLQRVMAAAKKEAGNIEPGTPTGFEDASLNYLIEKGVFHDPATGRGGPLQMANEAMLMPAAQLWQTIARGTAAGIHAAGGALGQIVDEFGGSQGQQERAKNEAINFGNWMMIEAGMGRFARPSVERATVNDRQVGGLPTPQDFSDAAQVLGPSEKAAPPASGMIRFYHGTAYEDASEFTGSTFVTPHENYARNYRGGPNNVLYTDLTKDEAIASGLWDEVNDFPINGSIENGAERLRPLASGAAEQNLRRAWQEDGIHPAEAIHDAEADAFVRHDLATKQEPIKLDAATEEVLTDTGGKPASLSAAAVEIEPEAADLATQPAQSPGRLAAAFQSAGDKLFDIGRDFQRLTAPMAMGTRDSIAMVKDFANSLRRNRWDWARIDDDVSKRFTPEARARMWEAADEESVTRQLEEKSPANYTKDENGVIRFKGPSGGDEAVVVREVPRSAAGSRGMFASDFSEDAAGKFVALRSRDGTQQTLLPSGMWVSRPSKPMLFDTAEEAEAAAKKALGLREADQEIRGQYPGLASLSAEERAAVEELQTRAQNAWFRARDLGMVEGEGLPAYTPRMVINTAAAVAEDRALPLNSIGPELRTRTAQMLHRKHQLASETEAAAKAKYGDQAELARDIRVLPLATAKLEDAIAGRTLINNIKSYGEQTGTETVTEGAIPQGEAKFFTLDHPAFRTWRPQFKDGKAVVDAEGHTIFEQVPIYIHGDFEGPLRAVLSGKSGPLYQGLMEMKGKTMSLIMNSPMIHNAVEWGRAIPAMPGKVATFKVYFDGAKAKKDVPLMHEAINNGLVPIGHRYFKQDITGLMESPDLTPGRSWTAKVLGFVPGLFDEGAGTAVKAAVDKAGDFWHNTLLWDRVADLQMGLYKNFRDDAVAKGLDPTTASRMAAHWANRYAGALPKEAMSEGATKLANLLMFSRSFTMGNLGVLKDVLTGLPKDVLSQIERDAGFRAGAINEAGEFSNPAADAVAYSKTMARRKAIAVVGLDMGLMYVGNSILQNAMNVMFNDSTLEKEYHGYAERFLNKMQAVREHPMELVQPLRLLEDLSATSANEPGKGDRIRVGFGKDGTAIYARNPVGKLGDEFVGWMTGPLDMMRKKMGTVARPAWQIMSNDAGFGRKIYDPQADTPAQYLTNIGRVVKHLVASQFPEGQIGAAADLVKGQGDSKIAALQAFGPFAGVTFSKGAPGGPAVGEMYSEKSRFEFRVQMAMPDVRRQIQRGDVAGAQQAMTGLGMDGNYQRWVIKTTLDPHTRLSAKSQRDFYYRATPEQKARMDRVQQPAAP